MSDIQFDRGYVNAEAAAAGRFGGGGSAAPAEGAAADFGFDDFLDIINPLQHIPVVSTLYREMTGDEIAAPARIFGGTLFGGPTGFLSAMVNTMFDEIAGQDVGTSVMAWFDGDGAEDPQIAQPAEPALTAAPLVTASGTLLSPAALTPGARSERPTAEPAAAQPPQDDGMLTGQDALNALFNDLRGSAPVAAANEIPRSARNRQAPASPSPTEPPTTATGSRPSGPAANPVAANPVAANPLIVAAEAPDPANSAALADQMLMALDKYRAMTQQRQHAGSVPVPRGPNDPSSPAP